MSLAVKYAMKKRMAKGGMACGDCASGQCMAHGGEVKDPGSDFDSTVNDIMRQRYSRGGQVANDTDMSADMKPNEFDELVLDGGEEFSYTGANSGDEIGNEQEDNDRDDTVDQIMRSRKKRA